jgi:hypothetical protein
MGKKSRAKRERERRAQPRSGYAQIMRWLRSDDLAEWRTRIAAKESSSDTSERLVGKVIESLMMPPASAIDDLAVSRVVIVPPGTVGPLSLDGTVNDWVVGLPIPFERSSTSAGWS